MPEPEPEVSVVMPCLNEAQTVRTCIEKARRSLEQHGVLHEIIIADNGSTDDSARIATDAGARVVHVAEKGYGAALSAGIAAARGTFVIMGDADDSYDFAHLMPFVEKLRSGADLVMGNRFAGRIEPGAMPWKHRWIGNPALTGIGRLLFHSPVHDFHCGLRGFRCDAIRQLDLRTTGMEFASEMVVKATLQRLRIEEIPTTLSPAGRERPPHLRSWRDGWRHLRFLLLYSPRWLFVYPGAMLMIVGAIVGLWLLPRPRHIGSVELDVHTLIYAAAAVLIGFQAIAFGFFTKIFAISEGLLPPDPKIERWSRHVTLEGGLIVGLVLILAGLFGSVYAIVWWGRRSFGPLDPVRVLRIVIPSATALALGCQVVLTSFFLSVLGLRRR
jgi:glycosyltransferase involved in cell wall biosynthesis